MITNLMAVLVVTFQTNVTERFPTHTEMVDDVPQYQYQFLNVVPKRMVVVADPTPDRKWVRTTVLKKTRLEAGGYKADVKEEIVSDLEVEYGVRRVETWYPKGTNDCKVVWLTNRETVWLTNVIVGSWVTNIDPAGAWRYTNGNGTMGYKFK